MNRIMLLCFIAVNICSMDHDEGFSFERVAVPSLQDIALERMLILIYTGQLVLQDFKPGGKRGLTQEQFEKLITLKAANRDQVLFLARMILSGNLLTANVDGKGHSLSMMIGKKKFQAVMRITTDAQKIAHMIADGQISGIGLRERVGERVFEKVGDALEASLDKAIDRKNDIEVVRIVRSGVLHKIQLASAMLAALKNADLEMIKLLERLGVSLTIPVYDKPLLDYLAYYIYKAQNDNDPIRVEKLTEIKDYLANK